MNTSKSGGLEYLDRKVWRFARACWLRLAKRRGGGQFGSDANFYFQELEVQGTSVVETVPEAGCELKAPHRVQVCDLSKSEAEELLDCLEHDRGPYLFVECRLGAHGYTVSYLTRRWRPEGQTRTARQAESQARRLLGGRRRVGMAGCRTPS